MLTARLVAKENFNYFGFMTSADINIDKFCFTVFTFKYLFKFLGVSHNQNKKIGPH